MQYDVTIDFNDCSPLESDSLVFKSIEVFMIDDYIVVQDNDLGRHPIPTSWIKDIVIKKSPVRKAL